MRVMLLALSLLFVSGALEASTRVRHVQVKGDQIIVVRTALGVATIIQVPDKPNSVVVGDQEAFKIEYLDQAVTIKPLHGRAKSNLYIYTDWRRFNAQLVTGAESEADYVVYFEHASAASEVSAGKGSGNSKVASGKGAARGIHWAVLHRRAKSEDLFIDLKRVGRTPDGVLLLEFSLSGPSGLAIKPDWFWLTQAKKTRPIHGLFLSGLEVKPGGTVQGTIQILSRDVEVSLPLYVEIRRGSTLKLTIPRADSWK